MSDPRQAIAAAGLLPDVEIDLAGAALQLARIDQPDRDWQAVAAHLSELARAAVVMARGIAPRDLQGQAEALAGLISGSYNYQGDILTYDDPANANLIRVVERRRGLPVALGILWLHCAHAAGWRGYGIDFPGHFLIALGHQPPDAVQLVIDAFTGRVALQSEELRTLLRQVAGEGAELAPGVLAPMSNRRVLLRLQENVRVRRLRQGDFAGALAGTADMLLLSPDDAALWRDAANLNERCGRVAAAIKCLTRVLDLQPEGEAAAQTRRRIDRLRASLT